MRRGDTLECSDQHGSHCGEGSRDEGGRAGSHQLPQAPSVMSRPRRICFVSNNVYTALTNTSAPYIGGAEVQQAIIGRCLQQKDHQVSFVTTVFCGQRDDEVIDGMEVYKTYASEDGVPVVRFFWPRLSRLWQSLKKADADVYYQRCADKATGICALFCRRYGRKFVFSGAHDTDFERQINLKLRERILYRWGLRNADIILVQSEQQKRLLRENYGLDGYVMANVYPTRELTKAEGYVLWVGNMKEFKRPLLCLEVARRFPQVKFIMIGGPGSGSTKLYDQVRAQKLPNVEFLGFQPLEITEKYFDRASLLLNTSSVEGFPNTYLQAWSRGIPTVGTFDPNGTIAKNNLGRVVTDVSEIGDWFNELRNASRDDRQRIQRCFEHNFTPDRYVDGLLSILKGAAQ